MLVGMHERSQRPDAILFADTGGEFPETYAHVEAMRQWVKSVGFPEITTVGYTESRHGTLEQECLNNETLPSKAFGFSGCSVKWKRQPMDRWTAEWAVALASWERGEKVNRLIGIHAGESRRGRIPDTEKYAYVYPLREWKWGQEECVSACLRAGVPIPRKSSCFFCPAMKKHEVIRLKHESPDLYQRALAIEQNAANNLETVKGLGRAYSWESLGKADDAQLKLFQDFQAPLCDVCFDGGDE